MCGICYVKRTDGKPARKMIEKRYKKQKYRGSEGFGYLAIDDKNKIVEYRKAKTEAKIIDFLEDTNASEILFHHRFPTSTPNFEESAHPIFVSNEALKHDYYLVHNGIISNDDALKAKHDTLGFDYTTQVRKIWQSHNGKTITEVKKWNDSEALAIELALAIDSDKDEIGTRGSIAFIMYQVAKHSRKIEKIFWGRNTNPLMLQITKDFVSLCSEGAGEAIEADKLFSFDYTTRQTDVRDFKYGLEPKWDYQSSAFHYPKTETMGYNYGGYDDEDGYWELMAERDEIMTSLSKPSVDEYEEQYLLERLEEVDAEIKAYDEVDLRKALAS